jgi:DNA (cytosine-5)-methyltransferase 1
VTPDGQQVSPPTRLLTVGSLCAGIGGIEYGLELTGGFRTIWQAEINPFARSVLAKHWPDAQRLEDVHDVTGESVPRVDLITAGFPCQPFSVAGARLGASDERHLWPEVARVVRDLRPRWMLAENVAGLLTIDGGRTFGRILSDLADIGYDAEWTCLPAGAFGAHHIRNRLFILAYPRREGLAGTQQAPVLGTWRREEGGAAAQQARAVDSPGLGGMVYGVPRRVDRIKALGNAVVPQVARWIGQHILAAEARV